MRRMVRKKEIINSTWRDWRRFKGGSNISSMSLKIDKDRGTSGGEKKNCKGTESRI